MSNPDESPDRDETLINALLIIRRDRMQQEMRVSEHEADEPNEPVSDEMIDRRDNLQECERCLLDSLTPEGLVVWKIQFSNPYRYHPAKYIPFVQPTEEEKASWTASGNLALAERERELGNHDR